MRVVGVQRAPRCRYRRAAFAEHGVDDGRRVAGDGVQCVEALVGQGMQFAEGAADTRPPASVYCGHGGGGEVVDALLRGHDTAAGWQGEGGDVGERVAADGGPPSAWARVGQVDGAVAGDGGLGAGAGPVRCRPFAAGGAEVGQ